MESRRSATLYVALLVLFGVYYFSYAQFHVQLSPEEVLALAQKVGGHWRGTHWAGGVVCVEAACLPACSHVPGWLAG